MAGQDPIAVDLVLKMGSDFEGLEPVSRDISGGLWNVTELFGTAWQGDEEATLTIDEDLNFTVQGACNRFSGQIRRIGRGISVSENLAATMLACPAPTEELDRQLVLALVSTAGYVRYGGGIVMLDAQDRAVLHALRADK